MPTVSKKIHPDCGTRPAELRAPVHRRAKLAASLTGKTLKDFVSDAADRPACRILKKHNLPLQLSADASQAQ